MAKMTFTETFMALLIIVGIAFIVMFLYSLIKKRFTIALMYLFASFNMLVAPLSISLGFLASIDMTNIDNFFIVFGAVQMIPLGLFALSVALHFTVRHYKNRRNQKE